MQKKSDAFLKALVQGLFQSDNFDGNWIKPLIFCRHFSVDLPKTLLQKLSAIPNNVLLSCQDHPSNNVANLFIGFFSLLQMEFMNEGSTLFSGFKFCLLMESCCYAFFVLLCWPRTDWTHSGVRRANKILNWFSRDSKIFLWRDLCMEEPMWLDFS